MGVSVTDLHFRFIFTSAMIKKDPIFRVSMSERISLLG